MASQALLRLRLFLMEPTKTGFSVAIMKNRAADACVASFGWDDLLDAATDPATQHADMLATADALTVLAGHIREHVEHQNKPAKDE